MLKAGPKKFEILRFQAVQAINMAGPIFLKLPGQVVGEVKVMVTIFKLPVREQRRVAIVVLDRGVIVVEFEVAYNERYVDGAYLRSA